MSRGHTPFRAPDGTGGLFRSGMVTADQSKLKSPAWTFKLPAVNQATSLDTQATQPTH